ncbi:MAG: hypothetical protein ACI8Q1_003167 [Parvicella sp.]|jgi:hypothetical protein
MSGEKKMFSRPNYLELIDHLLSMVLFIAIGEAVIDAFVEIIRAEDKWMFTSFYLALWLFTSLFSQSPLFRLFSAKLDQNNG